MDDQPTAAAKTLARWCYRRGVDERILSCGEQLRQAALHQALGRPAPPHLEHAALWHQTATLLRQRRDWDRDHHVSSPPTAECLPCAVAADQCPTHAGHRCRACGGRLHRIVVDEGFDTHPCCDRPAGPVPAPSSIPRHRFWAARRSRSPPEHDQSMLNQVRPQ